MNTIISFGPSLIILILGIFLLLVAIIGGGIEVKELKLPKIEKTPRILTAVLGISLMLCGAFVGIFSFMYSAMSTKTDTVSPTAVSQSYTPNTDYISTDKIQLPQNTDVPKDLQEATAKLIVAADKAEILANFYQDDSYLNKYYAGDALQRLQQGVEDIKNSNYIVLEKIDLNNSYYVKMNYSNTVLSIDECEYWKDSFYDSQTGDLVKESNWKLVPQTISIELVQGEVYITSISFYQGNAFCTQ